MPAPDAQPNVARHDVLWVQRNPEQGRNRRPRGQVPVRNGDQPDPKQRPDPAASLQASLQARCALQEGLCINPRIHNCGEQPAPLPTDPWAIIKSPYGGKLSPNDQWVILSSQGASHKPAVHVGLFWLTPNLADRLARPRRHTVLSTDTRAACDSEHRISVRGRFVSAVPIASPWHTLAGGRA